MWLIGYLTTATGLLIGGFLSLMFNKFQKDTTIVYSICSGLILGLLSLEIVPEGIRLGGWVIFILGFIIAVLVYKLFHLNQLNKEFTKQRAALITGLFLAFSICLHNLPIGFILSSESGGLFNTSLLKAIFFHNIPEGMILFTPFIIHSRYPFNWLFLSFIVAFPVGIGVVLGGLFAPIHPFLLSFMISFAVGTMYMITISEVLVYSLSKKNTKQTFLFSILGFGCIAFYFFII